MCTVAWSINRKKSCENQEMNKSSMGVLMESHDEDVNSSETKKNKVIWTPDLHQKFLEAVEKIGVHAVPKKILELMKVEGLTRDHIASHLQKYRIFLKKIADANNHVEIASKPSLLESSMINEDPWKKLPLISNQPTPQQMNFPSNSVMHEVMNPPVLDTSSFSFPFLKASSCDSTTSSELTHLRSSPNEGYSMQEAIKMSHNSLEDVNKLGIMNSGCVSHMQNLDGFMYDDGGSPSTEMGPFGGVYTNNELHMSWNHECSYGLESDYSSHSGFVENGSMFSSKSNVDVSNSWYNEMEMCSNHDMESNLQNVIEEDDLILDASYIASLWETFFPEEPYGDDYRATSDNLPPYQQQHSNAQLMRCLEDGVTLKPLYLNSSIQD
ncbi:hypothetical protein LXL04_035287 [Taraxacum kok-saghyz]